MDVRALELGSGDGFQPISLTGPPKSLAAEQVVQAGGRAQDIKVPLVQDDAAGQAGVRVDADPEQDAAALGVLNRDQEILEFRVLVRRSGEADRERGCRSKGQG
jgi:hypothetical protein